MNLDRLRVCLFAKAPVRGQVKTRMQSLLSVDECLALHRDLLRTCCENLARLPASVIVELHATGEHPEISALGRCFDFVVKQQRGRNLGARMSHAVRQALQEAQAVVLVGADCPMVDAVVLDEMREHLQTKDAVLVPATDGGYVALGLRQHSPRLFCDIPWGSESVAEITCERLESLGWAYSILAEQPDFDRPEDLALLSGGLGSWAALYQQRV